jgi:hypothetical protein
MGLSWLLNGDVVLELLQINPSPHRPVNLFLFCWQEYQDSLCRGHKNRKQGWSSTSFIVDVVVWSHCLLPIPLRKLEVTFVSRIFMFHNSSLFSSIVYRMVLPANYPLKLVLVFCFGLVGLFKASRRLAFDCCSCPCGSALTWKAPRCLRLYSGCPSIASGVHQFFCETEVSMQENVFHVVGIFIATLLWR